MYCGIRAVEQKKCAAGLFNARPGLHDRILLTTKELRMRMKYAKKLSFFVTYRNPANVWFSFFPAETAVFELV